MAAGLVAIATFSHASFAGLWPVLGAALVTIFASVTPLVLKTAIRNGAAFQLSVVTWRLMVMLPALAWGMAQTGATRNSFLTALMACYFVALPLESWLLVRDASPRRPR
jgi:hypothetical protein